MTKLTATQSRTLALIADLGEVHYDWKRMVATNELGARVTGFSITASSKLLKSGLITRQDDDANKTYIYRVA